MLVWSVRIKNFEVDIVIIKYDKSQNTVKVRPLPFRYTTVNVSKQCIAVSNNLYLTLRETHMPYGITQCYLPPDRGENHAFAPSRSRYSI